MNRNRLDLPKLAAQRAHDAELLPVLVMNPYYSGIGIARCLRRHGVKVHALTSERDAAGLRSRYFAESFEVPNGRDEPGRLCERLLEIRDCFAQRPVIFPTRDFDVLFLQEYRRVLAPHYLLPQREDSPILRVMDKLELAREAIELKIPTPLTLSVSTPAELEESIARLEFPVIIKPRFAYQWRRMGVWERVGAQKAIIVKSAAALREQYDQLASVTQEILLQSFVPGDDNEIVVCGCYVDRLGEMLGYFTGRKLRQSPPLVGTGSVVEACDVTGIVAPSAALLRAFGYAGIAEVEFKRDKSTGLNYLIEINPRHWDQHELGTLVGVNLSWIAYRDLVGRAQGNVTPSYDHRKKYIWIAETELMKDVARSACLQLASVRGSKTWVRDYVGVVTSTVRDLSRLLGGRKIYAIVRVQDPVPGLLLLWRWAREVISFVGFRGRRKEIPVAEPDRIIR